MLLLYNSFVDLVFQFSNRLLCEKEMGKITEWHGQGHRPAAAYSSDISAMTTHNNQRKLQLLL